MDAITLLKQDHRTVEKMFSQFKKAKGETEQAEMCQQICRELTLHAQIEEKSFYPEVKAKMKEMVLESLEEHKQVKTLVGELEGMKAGDELMQPKMKVLKEDVKHHVDEEEKQMFPKLTRGLGKERLMDIGERLRQDKMAMMGKMGRGEGIPMAQRVMEEVRETVKR